MQNGRKICVNNEYYVKGYFTVEATCLYPFVIAVILLVIYIWFFLYDRCLMEQDFAGVLVKGIAQQEMKASERSEYMESKIRDLYDDQYLCWDFGELSTQIDGINVELSAAGSIEFPFTGLNFWGDSNVWEASRTYKAKVYDKIFVIRTYRKMAGFLQ